MQLVLGEKHLGKERIYKKECLPNLEIFRKFEETTHTQKYARKRIDIENALKTHWRGSQKEKTFGFVQVALAMRSKKNSLPDE